MEKIHWLEEAIEDLNQIYIFISQDSVYYAIKTTEEILKRASEKGNRVHKAIEEFEQYNFNDIGCTELRNYKFLKKHHYY